MTSPVRAACLVMAVSVGLAHAAPPPAAKEWARARQALMARPAHTLDEIARELRTTPAALTALIDAHEGREPFRAARRRALAERIAARLPMLKSRESLRAMARELADELPHLEDHDLARLKRQHPQILRALAPRGFRKLDPPIRARVRDLAFAHPTLEHAELAKLYAADPKLAGVLEWSADEVYSLMIQSRVVPTDRVRLQHFAGMAADRLGRLKPGSSVDDGVAALSAEHPHVDEALLVRLAAHEPKLAKALRALEAPATAAAAPSPAKPETIDLKTAKALGLSVPLMSRALSRPGSPLVVGFLARILELEREHGDGTDALRPRDVIGAGDLLRLIISTVHGRLGVRTLRNDELAQALPAAIAAVAKTEQGGFYRAVAAETIDALADAYWQDVILGGKAPSTFAVHRGLSHVQWRKLRKATGRFPAPGDVPLEGERLEAVARFYQEVLAKRMTMGAFYRKSGLTAPQLRVLQASDPTRFPRPDDTPVYRTLKGRRNLAMSEAEIVELSRRWQIERVERRRSIVDFQKLAGVPAKQLLELRRARPEAFPDPQLTEEELADLVGGKATALFERDVLSTHDDLLRALNQDPEIIGELRRLTKARYWALHAVKSKAFPPLKDRALVVARLREEALAILAREPGLAPGDLTVRMQARHPRFKRSRVDQLGLFEKSAEATSEQRRADAEELADRMAESGDSIVDIAKAWHAEDPRIEKGYLYRLRKDFEAELFHEGALARRPPDRRRSSHAIGELYSLAIRLSAPGTGERALLLALNRLLVERGLPPYPDDRQLNTAARVAREHGTLVERGAAIAAEVVAEYARAARYRTSEEAILAAVQNDYPTLDAFKLSTYRRLWLENPRAYPALGRFIRGGELALGGRGERLPRRYRGGWDVERALLAAAHRDPALAEELARYSEYARIPASLPLLDEMVTSLGGKRPLSGHNVLMVSHLLGSSVPLARALARAGALAKSTIVVGTPYGTNPAVRRTLEAEGFRVRVPELSPIAYRAAVEKAVADMVEQHRRNHKPVVVLDDGGLVAEILHTDPRYRSVRHAFKIVEQTTRGITAAEAYDLKGPIVSVAGSESKKAEAEFIGRAVARKLVQGLGRLNKRVKGARVTVVGYGNVGRAIARELALLEAEVVVVEPSEARALEAGDAGFQVRALEDALEDADLVVGASGSTSIKLEHLRRLRSGTVVVSASSKRLEIEMERLEAASSRRTPILARSPLVRLPTARYRLGNRDLIVLGDGWPVNFDGDVEDIDPEEIQLTRAAMFAGALQAASIHINHAKNKGIVPLDPDVDAWILGRFRELRQRAHRPGIRDPDRWMEVIREVHKSMSG